MTIGGVNVIAVLAAGIAGFMVGGAWYGLLSHHWMDAAGLTKDQVAGPDGRMPMGPMVRAIVADLIIAAMLAGIMERYAGGEVTVGAGLLSGALVALGFVVTTLSVNHGYQGQPLRLTVIDGGHWLAAFMVMGAVIGAFG